MNRNSYREVELRERRIKHSQKRILRVQVAVDNAHSVNHCLRWCRLIDGGNHLGLGTRRLAEPMRESARQDFTPSENGHG